jgi:hypothetical protein
VSQPTQLLVAADATTPAATLRAAASYLARYGWVQGCLYDPSAVLFTPAACLVGALGMVCYGGPVDAPAHHTDDPGYGDFDEALTHLEGHLAAYRYGVDVYEFNDAKDRTLDQVLLLLDDAAASWDDAYTDTDDSDRELLFCGCHWARVIVDGHWRTCPFSTVGGAA